MGCNVKPLSAFSPNLTALKLKISNFELPNYSRIFLKLWIRRIFWREFTEFNSLAFGSQIVVHPGVKYLVPALQSEFINIFVFIKHYWIFPVGTGRLPLDDIHARFCSSWSGTAVSLRQNTSVVAKLAAAAKENLALWQWHSIEMFRI